ncbi:MAG: AAA family ATPase, partial [Actinobacteria bacterium]
TEMDGFTGNEGVIVLAATNRPEILDSALLRPGRFDRRVVVSPPDQVGRQQILQVHTRSVPLADDVDLSALASTTAGMVGADLKNLVNEAALLAARREHERVALADFTDALEKIILGTERRLVLSQDERERTAYHESGHALLGMLQPGADPVRKISIVPRGSALGVTFQSPESDRYSYEKKYLQGRIIGMLGGRAAEELVYDEVTTGAANDLERVSQIARQMVGRWGMSDVLGPVSLLPSSDSDMPWFESSDGPSAATRELVDREVRRIVDDCYADALRLLRENRNKLDALAQALLIRETLDEADAYRIAGVVREPKPALL